MTSSKKHQWSEFELSTLALVSNLLEQVFANHREALDESSRTSSVSKKHRPVHAATKKSGHHFDWNSLVGFLKPGMSTYLEKPEGFTMNAWQSLVSARCCLMHGRGKCKTHRIIDSFVPRVEVRYIESKKQRHSVHASTKKKSRRNWDKLLEFGDFDYKDLMTPTGMTTDQWQKAINQACRSRFNSFKTSRIGMIGKHGSVKRVVRVQLMYR